MHRLVSVSILLAGLAGVADAVRAVETPATPEILSLERALAQALQHHPTLAAAEARRRAAEAEARQAGRRPNPAAELESEEFGGSGGTRGYDGAVTTFRLSRPIELGGKRDARRAAAQAAVVEAECAYRAEAWALRGEAAKRFVDTLAAQERLALAQQAQDLAEGVHQAVQEKVDAGREVPAAALRTRAALAQARQRTAQSARQAEEARLRLAGLWSEKPDGAFRVQGPLLGEPAKLPPLETLRAAMSEAPARAAAAAAFDAARAAQDEVRRQRTPDVELTAGLQDSRADDTRSLVAGLRVELPWTQRAPGAAEAAQARVDTAQAEQQAERRASETALVAAHGQAAAAWDAVRALREEVLPLQEEALAAVQKGYRLGKYPRLDLLDAQQVLIETRNALLQAELDYRLALLALEEQIGRALSTFN